MNQIVQHQGINAVKDGIAQSQTTMTSREIAELCDARHNDVVETIERLFSKGVLRESRNTQRAYQAGGGGRPTMIYDLTKRDCLVVVSGYSDELRAKIIDRWIELEAAALLASAVVTQKPTAIHPSKEFRALFGIARLIGMDKNAAAISANHGVKALTGTNLLALMDATHLKSEKQSLHFTPTELGKRLCVSAITFNRKLADAGLQERISGHWSPTLRGKPYAVVLDTGKAHESGTPVQQVKWIEAVLDEVAA